MGRRRPPVVGRLGHDTLPGSDESQNERKSYRGYRFHGGLPFVHAVKDVRIITRESAGLQDASS
jgi:hypothetical protein